MIDPATSTGVSWTVLFGFAGLVVTVLGVLFAFIRRTVGDLRAEAKDRAMVTTARDDRLDATVASLAAQIHGLREDAVRRESLTEIIASHSAEIIMLKTEIRDLREWRVMMEARHRASDAAAHSVPRDSP